MRSNTEATEQPLFGDPVNYGTTQNPTDTVNGQDTAQWKADILNDKIQQLSQERQATNSAWVKSEYSATHSHRFESLCALSPPTDDFKPLPLRCQQLFGTFVHPRYQYRYPSPQRRPQVAHCKDDRYLGSAAGLCCHDGTGYAWSSAYVQM
jgi:hypothetical protein